MSRITWLEFVFIFSSVLLVKVMIFSKMMTFAL